MLTNLNKSYENIILIQVNLKLEVTDMNLLEPNLQHIEPNINEIMTV